MIEIAMTRPARALLVVLLGLTIGEASIRLAALLMRRDAWAGLSLPAGKVIYAVGDSFTYGTGVERHLAFPQVLERLLRESGLEEARVVNNGWPGLSSANALFAVAKILDEADPALVLVMTGWNANDTDFERHREAWRRHSWTNALDNTLESLRLYRISKQLLTSRVRTAHLGDVELVPQAPAMELYDFRAYQEIARKHLQAIAELCHARDTPLVLLNYPYQHLPDNPWALRNEYYHLVFGRTPLAETDYIIHEREAEESGLHSVIRTVGTENNVPVIDLRRIFADAGSDTLYQTDWHHPTVDGHRVIALAIFDRIAPILSADTG